MSYLYIEYAGIKINIIGFVITVIAVIIIGVALSTDYCKHPINPSLITTLEEAEHVQKILNIRKKELGWVKKETISPKNEKPKKEEINARRLV